MNRTKIEYLDVTWNPVVGCSGVGCAVRTKCWARAMAKRQKNRCLKHYSFVPHLHPERLYEPLNRNKPSRIGVCFMGDLFDHRVERDWQRRVFRTIQTAYWHIFICLTKQPQHVDHLDILPNPAQRNFWVGVSVNKREDLWRIERLREANVAIRIVSFEPLYEDLGDVDLTGIDWVIMGAQTRPQLNPDAEWVESLILQARRHEAAVFLKNNLPPLPNFKTIREFPSVWKVPHGTSERRVSNVVAV